MKTPVSPSFGSKLYRYLKDPRVSLWRKLVGVGALAYLVMPFDIVPDVIPFLGWLDDVGVIGVAATFMVREVQKHAARLNAQPPTPPERP